MDTINIRRGNKVVIPITFKDADGNAIDITGGTVTFTVKAPGANANAIQKIVTTFSDPTHGKCDVTLDTTDTSQLWEGRYFYDVKLVTSSINENTDIGILNVTVPLS